MIALKAFLAGFLSTLTFHQAVMAVLHAAGGPMKPYNMAPVKPLGIPSVVSLAVWGGLWGIVLYLALLRFAPSSPWLFALVFGAIAPSLVALLLVFPLKGQPIAAGGNPKIILGALLVNGAWGIGVLVFIKLFAKLGWF